jgi:hypothetical protein
MELCLARRFKCEERPVEGAICGTTALGWNSFLESSCSMPRVVKRSAPKAVEADQSRRDAPLPQFVSPQLSLSVETPPPGSQWVHEIKLDGYRMAALRRSNLTAWCAWFGFLLPPRRPSDRRIMRLVGFGVRRRCWRAKLRSKCSTPPKAQGRWKTSFIGSTMASPCDDGLADLSAAVCGSLR